MPKIDYSKTVIYQLKCRDKTCDYVYVNHTTDAIKRKYFHKTRCISHTSDELYEKIAANGGWENWQFIILDHCQCDNKADAEMRVQEWSHKLSSEKSHAVVSGVVSEVSNLVSKIPKIVSGVVSGMGCTENADKLTCRHCNRRFTYSNNLYRHMANRCNKRFDGTVTKYDEPAEKILEKPEIVQIIKQQIEKYMNENCVMHPRTLNRLNNRIKNSNNNNNNRTNNINIQGNTIHNNQQITIVELGKENLSEFFTKEQQMQILNRRYNCLDYLIETVHFNNKNKQFQNVAITNVHDRYAYKYVEKEKRFIMVNKESLMDDMMSYRIEDIREFFENQQGLSETTYNAVKRFLKDMDEDEKKLEQKTCDIKLIMYNKRDMLELTL